jgi:hypothetical protein
MAVNGRVFLGLQFARGVIHSQGREQSPWLAR